jgi:hypothetical protein
VKFSLGGDRGPSIFEAGSPSSLSVSCSNGAAIDAIESTVSASSSSLSYDGRTDTYTYVWKTQKSWAGTCRQLAIALNDGSTHYAVFKFKN